jgi:hypothetical protein
MNVHRMVCEGENAAEVLFVCTDDQCGRRVVLGKSRPKIVVIDDGELGASHLGSMGGVFIDDVDAA